MSQRSQIAFALAGLLALAAAGALLLPRSTDAPAEAHQTQAGPLAVTLTGSPPTTVAVVATYPVGDDAMFGAPLLDVKAEGIGPGGKVTLKAYPPGQTVAPPPVDIPGGVLLVQGDASTKLTVTVTTPSGLGAVGPPAQVAKVVVDAQAGTIDLHAAVPGKAHVHYTYSRFWFVDWKDTDGDGEDDDAVKVTVANPLATVSGKVLNTNLNPPGPSASLLEAEWSSSTTTFTVRLPRTGVPSIDPHTTKTITVHGASVSGDPFGPGLVVRAEGADQVRLQLGSTANAFRVTLGGEALKKVFPDGTYSQNIGHYGHAPWDAVVQMWYGNQLNGATDAHYLQPRTLRPLFGLATSPQGALEADIPTLGRTIAFPGGTATVSVDAASGEASVRHAGAKVLGARVEAGTPPRLVLTGPALAQAGLQDPTVITQDYLASAVLTTAGAAGTAAGAAAGNAQAAALAAVSDHLGNVVAEAEDKDGKVTVRIGPDKLAVAGGSIAATGPQGLPGQAGFAVKDAAGATVVSVGLTSPSPLGPGAGPVVVAQAAGQPPVTVSQPLVLTGPAGAWTGVRVVNPVDTSQALVELKGNAVWLLGQKQADVPGAPDETPDPLAGQGDPLGDPEVTISQGGVTLRVDRRTQPPTVHVQGIPDVPEHTIQAPVVVVGPPTAPSGVTVYNPLSMPDPPALVSYQTLQDGTSKVTLPDGSTQTLPSGLVFSEGLPLASPQWRLTLRPPGQPAQTVVVDRAAVQGQLYANGIDIQPFVSVLGGAAPGVDFYKVASDGQRSAGPGNLAGQRWFNGNGDVSVRVDVPKEKDLYQPVLLYEHGKVPTRGSSPGALMSRVGEANGHVSYRAAIPSAWLRGLGEGAMVHFSLAFDLGASSLATQSFLDHGDGQGYRFRVDAAPPGMAVTRAVLDPARPTVLRVNWSAQDAGSGVASYQVQRGETRQGQLVWETWVDGAPYHQAEFAGTPGTEYSFRTRATDQVGNVGPWGPVTSERLPPPPPAPPQPPPPNQTQPDLVNDPPNVRLLTPTGGEVFQAVPVITIEWVADDPDGTIPVVTLQASRDGGATWETLASPSGSSWGWDVSRLGGEWRLKAIANDGSLSNADTSGRFTIQNANLATEETVGGPGGQGNLGPDGQPLPPAGGGQGTQGPGGEPASTDATVMVALGGVLIAAAGGVAAWQWRLRRLRR